MEKLISLPYNLKILRKNFNPLIFRRINMKNFKYFHQLIAVILCGFIFSACSVMSGRETAGQYVDDTSVTSRVKSAIIQDPELKARQIHVETFQGIVQLSGFIDSSKEKMRAEALALNTKGVQSVKNNLIVR